MFLKLTAILLSILFALFLVDNTLKYVPTGIDYSRLALIASDSCPTKNELVEQHSLSRALGDGGFRNMEYTKSAQNYLQVWADTLCMDKHSYLDGRKLRKIAQFNNQTYSINRFGYRGKEWDKELESDAVRVFIVGGSVAFSLHANEGDSIHRRLEEKLNQNSDGIRYAVFNAAAPGASATDEFNVLQEAISEFKPTVIIFLTGINNAGRGEGKYWLLRYQASKIFAALYKVFQFFGFNNLQNLTKTPTTINMQSREAFIKYEQESNKFCKANRIRCIFALQPTVLVERYMLSDSEKSIQHAVLTHQQTVQARNYEADFNFFNSHFQKKENLFEYLDLRDIGSMGLYSGWIHPASSLIFNKNVGRIAAEFLQKPENSGLFYLRANNENFNNSYCSEGSLLFYKGNTFNNQCVIRGYTLLSKHIVSDNAFEGYEKILANNNGNPLVFNFNVNSNFESIALDIQMKNYHDTNNIRLEAEISYDGANYEQKYLLTKNYLDGGFQFNWNIDRARLADSIFVKLKYLNSSQIGITSIGYTAKGAMPDFRLTDSFKIENMGNGAVLAVQRHRQSPSEIFVDAAHLTTSGNDLVAAKLAQQIFLGQH